MSYSLLRAGFSMGKAGLAAAAPTAELLVEGDAERAQAAPKMAWEHQGRIEMRLGFLLISSHRLFPCKQQGNKSRTSFPHATGWTWQWVAALMPLESALDGCLQISRVVYSRCALIRAGIAEKPLFSAFGTNSKLSSSSLLSAPPTPAIPTRDNS